MNRKILLMTLCTLLSIGVVHARVPQFKHVVIVAADGFSSEVMTANPGKFPNIEKLFSRGAHTLKARSVLPSSSAINWATLLMGAGSEMHGFTEWGSKTPEVEPAYVNQWGMFPGIFGLVRENMPQAKTGALYTWDGIGYLFEKKAVDLDYFAAKGDEQLASEAVKFIETAKPTLCFVCFAEPDGAGHGKGWMSEDYVRACEKIDSLVGIVVESIDKEMDPNQTAIIFTSDHGGINKGHGSKTMQEMEVPYVMVGRGIPQGHKIESIVMKYDNAPTVADMLGLPHPAQWRGRSIFKDL